MGALQCVCALPHRIHVVAAPTCPKQKHLSPPRKAKSGSLFASCYADEIWRKNCGSKREKAFSDPTAMPAFCAREPHAASPRGCISFWPQTTTTTLEVR